MNLICPQEELLVECYSLDLRDRPLLAQKEFLQVYFRHWFRGSVLALPKSTISLFKLKYSYYGCITPREPKASPVERLVILNYRVT